MSKPKKPSKKTQTGAAHGKAAGSIKATSGAPPGGGQKPGQGPPANADILTMPIPELESRVAKALDLAAQIKALLPGGFILTDVERRHTNGHVRTGEVDIWLQILGIAEQYPHFFESLADMDEGLDPETFEVELLRDRVKRAALLSPLVTALSDTSAPNTSDTALHLRSLVRGPVKEVYAIAKATGKSHKGIKNLLAPILDYYRKLAAAAQAAKAEKDAANATEQSGNPQKP